MYAGITTAFKMKVGESDGLEVKFWVRHSSVLSPLLFIIIMEALSSEFRVGLPWELFNSDDLCLPAETECDLVA
jgi:hypothetical protein